MIKRFSIAFILLAMCGCSCTIHSDSVPPSIVSLRTVEYDGCEYVVNDGDLYRAPFVHKGNCKFCEERKTTAKGVTPHDRIRIHFPLP